MRIKKIGLFILAALFIYLPVQAKRARRYPERQAILIASKDDLRKLAKKPDSTLLRTRSGKNVTLGKLRAYAKAHGTALGVHK